MGITLTDSLVSSSARKLPVHVRTDLSSKRQKYLGRSYWVVKDPIGLKYYRFQDEEYYILSLLDGSKSLDEIKDLFEAEFPPQKITLEELQSFLGMLHKSGLIVASVTGQGYELKKRRDERKRQELVGSMTNVLCIRFKGFDPERILNWLYPKVRFLFHPLFVSACICTMFLALSLVLINFDEFRTKLPAFRDFFTLRNAFLLGGCLAVTKVIHEFGHGLTCKHFGGECHEMGIMILVLTPCLYCNVSDSWMLPSKYRRAMIGAAGIYIEVTLASLCTIVWWNTQEGMLHYLCLNIMFLSSVSTIMFNANPLLRYDGYYITADLLEIPNLRQKASQICTRKLGFWCLGLEPPEDPFLPQRNQALFAIYSIAAVMYRWVVLCGILFFLYKVFEPIGLKVLGQAIAAMSLYGILVMPIVKLYKYLSVPGRLHQVKKIRMFATLGVLGALGAVILFVPLPSSVYAPLEIRLQDPRTVAVYAPGELDRITKYPGDWVEEGDEIAVLKNPDLQREILQLEVQKSQLESQWNTMSRQQATNPLIGDQMDQIYKAWVRTSQQLDDRNERKERLIIRAPQAGMIIPAEYRPEREDPEAPLPTWHGNPLMESNIGAFLDRRTEVCQIGNPVEMEARLIIDESDVQFVSTDEEYEVEIILDAYPFDDPRIEKIDSVRDTNLDDVSRRMSGQGGGPIPTSTDPMTGKQVPLSPSYEARVLLDNENGLLQVGNIGKAKIHVAPRTIGQRFWRLVSETFAFKL
jgi:putative peptide zinc metalloprotease protein